MFTVLLTPQFQAWLGGLADRKGQVRIVAQLRQAEGGNLGDWKPIEGSLSEMRVHFGPGYRLYFTRRGNVLLVVLAGGVKSTQARDIQLAKRILEELEAEL